MSLFLIVLLGLCLLAVLVLTLAIDVLLFAFGLTLLHFLALLVVDLTKHDYFILGLGRLPATENEQVGPDRCGCVALA